MIPFNVPPCGENAIEYIRQAIESNKICGDGEFTKKCSSWIEKDTGTTKALLTTSGTHALEMAAFLCDIKPGDEVILPSYTFSSTANAFVNVGAKLVFVDINPKTMNIDEDMILKAINSKTKVIVVVNYAGVSCDMKKVMNIARENNIKVVEDAIRQASSSAFW